MRKQQALQAQIRQAQAQSAAASASQSSNDRHNAQDGTTETSAEATHTSAATDEPSMQAHISRNTPNGVSTSADQNKSKQPPDLIDEVGQILKTAFPLLIMSLGTIVDQ